MRVLLIGTSNAIYADGYAGGIRDHHAVNQFEKHAIGASPSIIIPHLGLLKNFQDYDLVVFDTAINDRNYYKYGSIRKDQIRTFIEWGVASALSAGCKVALLLMPSKKAFDKETISGQIYAKVAAENGILLVDGFRYIREICDEDGVSLNDCFLDDFHILKPLAYKLGARLVDEVLACKIMPVRRLSPARFYRLDAASFSGVRTTRHSSLLSADFVLIDDNNEATVMCEPGHAIVGISFNAAKTGASLSIDGVAPQMVKSLVTPYSRGARDLTLLVAPIVGECIVGGNGEIRLRLARAEESPSEVSRFERISDESGLMYRSVEVSSLLLRAPD